MPPDLSAVILCYRAEESIHRVIDPLYAQLDASGIPFELVLVANYHAGSSDRTPAIVRAFADDRAEVRVVAREKQGAMGWDMRSGLDAASGSIAIVMDGDAQNPVEDVLRMYEEMRRGGYDVMKGRRSTRMDGPVRAVVSGGYNLLFRLLFRTYGLWDINGKPKGLTRDALSRLELRSDDWFIDAEMVLAARKQGLAIGELAVIFHSNEERDSFVRPAAIWEFVKNMLRARWRRP
jgi:glycosyltransferase involved in cell wall biosynthesis